MTLHYLEGFHYNTDDHKRGWYGDSGLNYVYIRGRPTYPDYAPRDNTYGMYNYGQGGWATNKYIFSGETVEEAVIGYKRNFIDGEMDDRIVLEVGNRGGGQMVLEITEDFAVRAWRGTHTGTVLALSQPGLIRNGCWTQLEFKIKVHNSTGYWYVRADGKEVFSGENYDTQYQATTGFDRIGIGGGAANSIADLYVFTISGEYNNDFADGLRVDTLHPNAPGTNTDWTPDSGTNWDRVNDGGDCDESSYVYSSTDGHVDTYHFEDLEVLSGETTILGVQVKPYAQDDQISGELYPCFYDGTKYTGSGESSTLEWSKNFNLDPSMNFFQMMLWGWDRDPGGGAWSEATINSGEFGIELNIP
jgi:hypothetical protein